MMQIHEREFDYRDGLEEAKAFAKIVGGELVESDTIRNNHKVFWTESYEDESEKKDAQVELCDIYITLNELLTEVKALRIALTNTRRH